MTPLTSVDTYIHVCWYIYCEETLEGLVKQLVKRKSGYSVKIFFGALGDLYAIQLQLQIEFLQPNYFILIELKINNSTEECLIFKELTSVYLNSA